MTFKTRNTIVLSTRLHYSPSPGRSACGRHLAKTAWATSSLDIIVAAGWAGTRCKNCWKSVLFNHPDIEKKP